MTLPRASVVIGILLGLLAACSNHPFCPVSKDFFHAPKGNVDAELMALCVSGELTAPDDLYDQVARNLEYIRLAYGVSVPKVSQITFRTPWVMSCVLVAFDDATAALVSQGAYHAWDELNATYHLKSIDTASIASSNMAGLYFEGRLNPRRLVDLYKGLPGVRYAEPNGFSHSFPDNLPNIYPRNTEAGLTYLFFDSEFWYFSRHLVGRPPVLVGHWLFSPDPVPALLRDALKNIELWNAF